MASKKLFERHCDTLKAVPLKSALGNLGDHQPYTATTKDCGSKKGFQRGWCTNCQNPREQQNVYHPQDCTGDVHHGFYGGGARIVGFDNWGSCTNGVGPECTKKSYSQSLANFVTNFHSLRISAARTRFLQFHSQNHSHSPGSSFATLNSQLFD